MDGMKEEKESYWTDERMELIIGNLLRAGVLIAAAVVFAGAIVFLIHHASDTPSYQVFIGEPSYLRAIMPVVQDAFAYHGRGMMQLGLLLLIATPVARVAFSIGAFALQRDLMYILITCIVLTVLLYSMAGGTL